MPSFSSTLKKEFFSWYLLPGTLLIALLYLSFSVFLLNAKLFETLLASHTSFLEMITLFISLFGGLWTSMSTGDFLISLLNALLVGINIILLLRTVYLLEQRGKVRLSIGGATLVSLVATGCTSCGLSLLSIFGLSASLSFLPFHGIELHVGAIALLIISAWYMLVQVHNGIYCKIPTQNASRGK